MHSRRLTTKVIYRSRPAALLAVGGGHARGSHPAPPGSRVETAHATSDPQTPLARRK